MNAQAAQQYLRTKVLTATPEQLQLMLFDGALRFGEQAREALRRKDHEQSYALISRVQRILVELSSTLKHDISPDLCAKLSALYNFAYRKLIEASVGHDLPALEKALDVLRYQRQTWAMLLEHLGKQKAAAAAHRLGDVPAPSERMEASMSVSG